MKKILTIFISGILFLGTNTAVFAQNYRGLMREVNSTVSEASRTAQHQQNSLDAVIKRSDRMITNRINWLNRLSTRVAGDKRLSSGEQSQMSADIQTEITNLNALKAKIDADTVLSTAQADSKQIVESYRVFAYFIPKEQLLITVNNLQSLTSSLQNLMPNVQNLINTLQSQGKNVSTAQAALSDINSTLAGINSKLVADNNELDSVSLSTTSYQTTFKAVRTDLESVRSSFGHIKADLVSIRQDFHFIITGGNSSDASSSAENHLQPDSSSSSGHQVDQ